MSLAFDRLSSTFRPTSLTFRPTLLDFSINFPSLFDQLSLTFWTTFKKVHHCPQTIEKISPLATKCWEKISTDRQQFTNIRQWQPTIYKTLPLPKTKLTTNHHSPPTIHLISPLNIKITQAFITDHQQIIRFQNWPQTKSQTFTTGDKFTKLQNWPLKMDKIHHWPPTIQKSSPLPTNNS
jgi:hypothetical protein